MHFDFYDHYHEQSISYKNQPKRLNNYLYTCWVILHAFLSPDKVRGIYFWRRPCVCTSVHSVRPSVHTFCLSGTISQYLLIRFNSFLVQMISTIDSQYPISLMKLNSKHLSYCPCFSIGNYKAKPILAFLCDDLHISSKLLY